MFWLNFGSWDRSAGRVFVQKRIYLRGYKWTPFTWIGLRYFN